MLTGAPSTSHSTNRSPTALRGVDELARPRRRRADGRTSRRRTAPPSRRAGRDRRRRPSRVRSRHAARCAQRCPAGRAALRSSTVAVRPVIALPRVGERDGGVARAADAAQFGTHLGELGGHDVDRVGGNSVARQRVWRCLQRRADQRLRRPTRSAAASRRASRRRSTVSSMVCATGSRRYSGSATARNSSSGLVESHLHALSMGANAERVQRIS